MRRHALGIGPRFRVRTLLVLVAIAALPVWGERMWRRRRAFLQVARRHETVENGCRSEAAMEEDVIAVLRKGPDALRERVRETDLPFRLYGERSIWRQALERNDTVQDHLKRLEDARWGMTYHGRVKRKYLRAAAFPWESVTPEYPGGD